MTNRSTTLTFFHIKGLVHHLAGSAPQHLIKLQNKKRYAQVGGQQGAACRLQGPRPPSCPPRGTAKPANPKFAVTPPTTSPTPPGHHDAPFQTVQKGPFPQTRGPRAPSRGARQRPRRPPRRPTTVPWPAQSWPLAPTGTSDLYRRSSVATRGAARAGHDAGNPSSQSDGHFWDLHTPQKPPRPHSRSQHMPDQCEQFRASVLTAYVRPRTDDANAHRRDNTNFVGSCAPFPSIDRVKQSKGPSIQLRRACAQNGRALEHPTNSPWSSLRASLSGEMLGRPRDESTNGGWFARRCALPGLRPTRMVMGMRGAIPAQLYWHLQL